MYLGELSENTIRAFTEKGVNFFIDLILNPNIFRRDWGKRIWIFTKLGIFYRHNTKSKTYLEGTEEKEF